MKNTRSQAGAFSKLDARWYGSSMKKATLGVALSLVAISTYCAQQARCESEAASESGSEASGESGPNQGLWGLGGWANGYLWGSGSVNPYGWGTGSPYTPTQPGALPAHSVSGEGAAWGSAPQPVGGEALSKGPIQRGYLWGANTPRLSHRYGGALARSISGARVAHARIVEYNWKRHTKRTFIGSERNNNRRTASMGNNVR